MACAPTTRAGVHDRARQHDRARLDAGAGRDPGGGVDDARPSAASRRPAPRRPGASTSRRRAEPEPASASGAPTGPGGRRQPAPRSAGVVGVVSTELDDPPRPRVGAGGLGDDARVLAAAEDDQRVGPSRRHADRRACAAGRGGRHAAMICATRSPARPSASSGRAAASPSPEAPGRARGGARRRPPSASAGDVDDVGARGRGPACRSPTFTAGRSDGRRLDQRARAVAEHRVGDRAGGPSSGARRAPSTATRSGPAAARQERRAGPSSAPGSAFGQRDDVRGRDGVHRRRRPARAARGRVRVQRGRVDRHDDDRRRERDARGRPPARRGPAGPGGPRCRGPGAPDDVDASPGPRPSRRPVARAPRC